MANINRHRVTWDGFMGGPGVSTFYSTDAAAGNGVLREMFNNIKGHIPADVHMTVVARGDVLDPVTGAIVNAWDAGGDLSVQGTSSGNYSAPTGFCIQWNTGSIFDGHRLRGHTYMVPSAGADFDLLGQLSSSARSSISDVLGTAHVASTGTLVVWHRPRPAGMSKGRVPHAVEARAGGYSAINGYVVLTKPAVLRSRRD